MATESLIPKFTAILSEDVVGYSRLMGEDAHIRCILRNERWAMVIGLFFLALCLLPTVVYAQQRRYSPEFQSLLNYVEQHYIAPRGWTFQYVMKRIPVNMAIFVGHGLRQQRIYAEQNPLLRQKYGGLEREARIFLADVARACGYRAGGEPLTEQDLWDAANDAMTGMMDEWVMKNFGVRTGTMPPVFANGPPPGEPRGPSPSILEEGRREDFTTEGEQLNLLDQPLSERPDSAIAQHNNGVKQWNLGIKSFLAGNVNGARSKYEKAKQYWAASCELGHVDSCSDRDMAYFDKDKGLCFINPSGGFMSGICNRIQKYWR
jgi:hypothetical protein